MKYAHNIRKENQLICTYYSDEPDGNHYLGAHETGCTCQSVPHLESTIVYEIVNGSLRAVTMDDIYDRMNDPNDTTVVIPTIE